MAADRLQGLDMAGLTPGGMVPPDHGSPPVPRAVPIISPDVPNDRAARLGADANALLRPLPQGAIAAASAFLRSTLGAERLFMTPGEGQRRENLSPVDVEDISTLASALPPGTVSRDPVAADAGSGEPRMASFIRQMESHAPATLAALMPEDEATLTEALREASMLGFTVGPGPRGLSLLPPDTVKRAAAHVGCVQITDGTSWQTLQEAAAADGLSIGDGLPDVAPTPMAAVDAGLYRNRGDAPTDAPIRTVTIDLPPGVRGRSARLWAFRDEAAAHEALHTVAGRFAPHYAATLPLMDAGIFAAIGQMGSLRHGRFAEPTSAGLYVVFDGSPISRRAALLEASWWIERKGGVCHHRGALPPETLLEAVAAATGTARLTLAPGTGINSPLLQQAKLTRAFRAIRGIVEPHNVLWYVRDLSRSLDEALELAQPPVATG